MEFLKFVRLIVVVIAPGIVTSGQENTVDLARNSAEICDTLAKEPYFGTEMVLGPPWRIYYTWNINLENKCLDITFKNATPMIVNRIYNDMNEYLESQPNWDAATLLLRTGSANHEMLLFANQGAAGRFTGVPNVVKDGNITPMKKSVPLLEFFLKLLYGGKYLLMTDCQIKLTTMSARSDVVSYRREIGSVASKLNLGDGFHACLSDKIKD